MKYLALTLLLTIIACSAKVANQTKNMSIIDQLKEGKDIYLRDQVIDESIDLSSILTSVKVNAASSQIRITSNLFFEGCTFKKPLVAYGRSKDFDEVTTQFLGSVAFINCKFESEVNFKYATFHGHANFGDTTFKERANFQDVTLLQRCSFRGAFWQEEAHFQNARFYHKANFMETKANGHCLFQAAYFRDEVNFSTSEFAKYVDFSLVKFDHNASFNYVKWKDRSAFNNATFMMDASFVKPEFGDASFKNVDKRGEMVMRDEKVTGKIIID